MSLFDIFKRESVTISAKSTLILPGSDQNRKVVCYRCEREIDERHEVEGCRKPSRRVFFGKMAAIAAGAAVVAKVAPELITAPAVKLPEHLSAESLLAHVREQQDELNRLRNQLAQNIVAAPEPVFIPSDIPAGFRSGLFHIQAHGFDIQYDARDHIDRDRVKIMASIPPVIAKDDSWREPWGQHVYPKRTHWSGKQFEGGLHETITMVNRELLHIALDLRQAIISCNPEYRWSLTHPEKPSWQQPAKEPNRAELRAAALAAKIRNPERLPA